MSTTPHSGSDREIQQELERAKSEAAQLASDAAETAKRRGREAADQAKHRAADRADDLASALETTADDLDTSESGEVLSGYGRSMAELMRRFAGGLREHEIEDFAEQLATFARRNPASFLAGSVALGFGVSRFLKATSTRSVEEYGYEDEDEYLLEEEEEFDFDEPGSMQTSGTDYGTSPGTDYGTSPGSDYGTSSSIGDERSTGAWPEDRGRERPGAGSSTDHWSPIVDEPTTGSASRSASGETGASSDGGKQTDRADTRREEIGRNEP